MGFKAIRRWFCRDFSLPRTPKADLIDLAGSDTEGLATEAPPAEDGVDEEVEVAEVFWI